MQEREQCNVLFLIEGARKISGHFFLQVALYKKYRTTFQSCILSEYHPNFRKSREPIRKKSALFTALNLHIGMMRANPEPRVRRSRAFASSARSSQARAVA